MADQTMMINSIPLSIPVRKTAEEQSVTTVDKNQDPVEKIKELEKEIERLNHDLEKKNEDFDSYNLRGLFAKYRGFSKKDYSSLQREIHQPRTKTQTLY